MAKYKVLATAWIDNALVQPGDVVEYNGEPCACLERVKATKATQPDPVAADAAPVGDGVAATGEGQT